MGRILNYLWRAWFVLLAAVLTVVLAPPVYILSFKDKHYRACYFFIRLWCLGLFYGMGFRYRIIRHNEIEPDKNTQYVFIANHTSIVDVLLPCILMPHHPLCYVGKQELEKIPIFGSIYRRVCVMVDRSSARSRADVYRRCAERIASGNSIVIFPEGGVSDDTSIVLDRFKDGAFVLSEKHHVPIAVFAFQGLKELFPFNPAVGRPGTVQVHLLNILQPAKCETLKNNAYTLIKRVLE